MRMHEIDWRYSSIREIFSSVSAALDRIKRDILPDDVDEALEQSEGFLGIAFVAAQTYISGTLGDARKLVGSTTTPKRKDLLKDYSDAIPGTTITYLQLCDHIANYFKHHDEWPNWDPIEQRKKTIEPLNEVGITETTAYPVQDAARLLWGFRSSDLEPLLSLLEKWRIDVIAAYK